ncbi:MAG: bifunctional 2-C-methyl-D-erythritol 4-phosphate cytidylyltransferase/2-C-methyl-D-erythritol 2,4-cyclodiphosphate synthase [Hyphomicrobiales bacterium]|nr:bifunctional 2-C-methyl-D-erythritol 4-phosphate cytidylyltransferase/2-C-methyl-D-erythritol 2,4-cyclodiphosphate synthase [Hyphomicrobiales bacterium]
MRIAAIIVAGGGGSRAGLPAGAPPKQYAPIAGRSALARSVSAFADHERVDDVICVIRHGDEASYAAACAYASRKVRPPAYGGATRRQSVLNGLRAAAALAPDAVLIHDAARPFVGAETIDCVIDALRDADGAIAAIPVVDSLKGANGRVIAGAVERDGLWRAQTPQGFRLDAILRAHEAAAGAGREDFSDDAAIAEWAGLRVALVLGSETNWKITTPEDWARAEREARMAQDFETRIGSGFDVHAFEPGDAVTLCGVRVPHTHRLSGHSDADAPLHALTDALLGAIGAGDIGDHFPPSDMQWRGADSAIFLAHARDLVLARGGRVVNVDVTILAERPKIAPHREAMRARMADILRISVDRVGLKATTMETLGFIGRREGLAAMASASVSLPAGSAR